MDTNKEWAVKYQTSVPNTYQDILPRAVVENILDNTSENKVVSIVAPFGYGKTYSVLSWLKNRSGRIAWIDMERCVNSETDFLNYLAAAVSSFDEKPDKSQGYLDSPEFKNHPRHYLTAAVSRIRQNKLEKILVFDNFHNLTSARLQGYIKELTDALIGTCRILILSRAELHPAFNQLIIRKQVRFITIKELSLNEQECMEYLKMNGDYTANRDIRQIMDETEGWPAALNVVLTVPNKNSVNNFEIFRVCMAGFFETEIWSGLDRRTREFLLKTSVLDILAPKACRAVTDESASGQILKWLNANGLFLSKLEEEDTFCYYHVFRNYLIEKQLSSDIDIGVLYKKYGWWLYDQEKYEKSFSYFFMAGDLYGVSQVLKILDPAGMGIESFLEMAYCITELNIADLKTYPTIVSAISLIHFLTGNIPKMQSSYHTLQEWSDAGILSVTMEDYEIYKWELGWLCYLDPDEPTLDNPKHLKFANYRYFTPGIKERHLARVSILCFPSFLRGIRDYGNVGIFKLESLLEQVAAGEENVMDEEESLWNAQLIMAEYKYENEDFETAERWIRKVMTMVEERGLHYLYLICIALLVKVIRASQNFREIDTLTSTLKKKIMISKDYYLLPNFHAFEQRNFLADGKAGFTEEFRRDNTDNEDKPYFFLLYRHITLVRVLLSTGEYNRAIIILQNLTRVCRKYKRPTDLVEVTILKAVALYQLGYEDDACQSFQAALDGAKQYGLIRIFSDDAKLIWPILELVKKQSSDNFLKKIIVSSRKVLARAGIHDQVHAYSHLSLTKTEIEILKCLQADLSYSEIALDNDIQISTVKSHIHSIYSKLDVSNKTAAVIVAEKLGILDN